MKRILVTGGPVPAKLDPVKLVTNKYKGGSIASLAETLSENAQVTYLCHSSFAVKPRENPHLKVITFYEFNDYKNQVLARALENDAVVLGAAVANLIPTWEYLDKKFPSHNYKPGDKINVEFEVAPRIIDMVKKANPAVKLFGFKLLAGHPYSELIRAAYETLLGSKATVVFANDASDISTKFMVTKERGVQRMDIEDLPKTILQLTDDLYYGTQVISKEETSVSEDTKIKFERFFNMNLDIFTKVPEGYYFGCVAVRAETGFVTTARGKINLDALQYTQVSRVDHDSRVISAGPSKATLNAPLLDRIFSANESVQYIAHSHSFKKEYPTFDYAPPGTVRDTMRDVATSFNVNYHGSYTLYDKDGGVI